MKIKWIFFSFALFFTLTTMGCRSSGALNVRLTLQNELLSEKSYPIPLGESIRVRKYGSLEKYREKTGLGSLEFLRKLSSDCASDVEEACEKSYVPLKEPDFGYIGDGRFFYTEGKTGRIASAEDTAARIVASDGHYSGEISFGALIPVLTIEDLKARTEKIASFSTDYSSSSPERKHNVRLAVERLDNKTVEGRAELSFNATVGKRTKENGFREAGVIAYGEFTRGIGGGVCQVSTTLYDAWMRAGFSAISKNHSLPVSYVPVGLDAMVSESNDLILKNDTDYPVFIDADCDGSKVTFTLYGTKPTEEIRLWSRKEKTFPCDEYELIEGGEEKVLSEPKDGSLYLSFRDYYKNGVFFRRELLRTSEYRKVKGKKITVKKDNHIPALLTSMAALR